MTTTTKPTNPNDSHVDVRPGGGTSFVGPDAIKLFRAITLASSLRLFANTGMVPTRGVTGFMMLKMATEFTGKTYKRGQHTKAAEDVATWIDTMKLAMPLTVNGVLP